MKKLIAPIVVAVVAAGIFAIAQTGYEESSAWTRSYTTQEGEVDGPVKDYIVTWSFDRFGGGGSVSNIDLLVDIPDNFVVFESWVDVIQPILPATAEVAFTLNEYGDLFNQQATTLATEGVYPLLAFPTNVAIKATADRDLTMTIAVNAATSGVARIYLRGMTSM